MTSTFNSKHNKYVSIPDWFKDVDLSKPEESTAAQTVYTGGSAVNGVLGTTNITLYNKYVLKSLKLNDTALTILNTALILKSSETHTMGDVVSVTGWYSTDFVEVAGGSSMTVTSVIDEDNETYGILFYDNRNIAISGHVLTESTEEVAVPDGAYFFRISVPSNETLSISYCIAEPYNSKQLELSNQNITNYLELNELIPEGMNATTFDDKGLKLLVQSPLQLTRDINNVIKLTAKTGDANDMFVWDKKLAAFGYDPKTGKAYMYVDGEQQFETNEEGEIVPSMTDDPDLWEYDEELEDKWIIKTTRQRFSILEGLMEYDPEKDSFLFHKNIITSGGIVMYADLGDVDVPGLYDGLPIDNDTIFWNYDLEGNKLTLSAKTISEVVIEGEGNAITNVMLSEDNKKLTFLKEEEFILANSIDNDTIYWDIIGDTKTLKSKRGVERIEIIGDGNAITSVEQSEDKESLFFKKEETFVTVDDIMDHIKTDDDTITVNPDGKLEVLKGGVEIVSSLPSYYEPDILYILV